MSKILDNNPSSENFFLTLMKQQLACVNQHSARGFRWHPDVIHWALTIQFHGGAMTLDDIRGKATKGEGRKGDLKVDPSLWGLFLPAGSTLRNYLPPVNAYEGVNMTKLEAIKETFSGENVIIGFDEIEIRKVCHFNPSTLEMVGAVGGPIPEKKVRETHWEDLVLADKVLQFFVCTIDGKKSSPLGFFPMKDLNGEKAWKLLKPIIDWYRSFVLPSSFLISIFFFPASNLGNICAKLWPPAVMVFRLMQLS